MMLEFYQLIEILDVYGIGHAERNKRISKKNPVPYKYSILTIHTNAGYTQMKAFKYLRQFFRFKRTARIGYRDKLTAVHFIKADLNPFAVTVLNAQYRQSRL